MLSPRDWCRWTMDLSVSTLLQTSSHSRLAWRTPEIVFVGSPSLCSIPFLDPLISQRKPGRLVLNSCSVCPVYPSPSGWTFSSRGRLRTALCSWEVASLLPRRHPPGGVGCACWEQCPADPVCSPRAVLQGGVSLGRPGARGRPSRALAPLGAASSVSPSHSAVTEEQR